MTERTRIILPAANVGIGGTAILDLWGFLLHRAFNIPATNWGMVGRWIGNMPNGRFVQQSMATATSVPGKRAIGWSAHYLIGAAYGLLLVGLAGTDWLRQPTILPPMIVALALLVAPWLIMMPGMGAEVAGSRTPSPAKARLKSLMGHSVFRLGMYLTARLLASASGAEGL